MTVDYTVAFYFSLTVNVIQYFRYQAFTKTIIKELGIYMERVDQRFSIQQMEIDSLKKKLKAVQGK